MTQKQTAREDFHAFRQRLLDAGYREKDVTFSAGRATGLGLVCALPFAALLLVVYRLALVHRAHLIDISGVSFYIALVLILALSVFAHELLHGLGWAVSSGRGWKAVRFNVSALMPSCACTVPLRRGRPADCLPCYEGKGRLHRRPPGCRGLHRLLQINHSKPQEVTTSWQTNNVSGTFW